jgi:membrane-associated phospholipid phosphatase
LKASRIALGAIVVATLCSCGSVALAQGERDPLAPEDTAPISTAGQVAAARRIVLDYKGGEIFPLRLFRGLDLLEPVAPFVATQRGDWGRVLWNTAVPYTLVASGFALRSYDRRAGDEARRWKWVGFDRKADNEPTLFALMALGAATLFLPSPEDGEDYSWQLRADRMAVFAMGMLLTELETRALKNLIHRSRPDRSDSKSRPSGHASATAAAMSFAADVLRDTFRPQDEPILLHRVWKEAVCALPYLGVGLICLQRMNADKHNLTDTLLGAAIGAFTMHMLYSWSFLRDEHGESWLSMASVGYNPEMRGIEFAIRGEF